MKVLAWLLYLLLAVLTPLLGVWLASSLVSFYGGPPQLALIGGALLFPVLPVLWELRATAAFKRSLEGRRQFGVTPKRKLDPWGRVVLRTLALNVLFIGLLVAFFPKQAFPALATRGDWFLDGQKALWAEKMRGDLHAAATGLEWLYELSHPNPYVKEGDVQPVPSTVQPIAESTFLPMPTARRWIPGSSAWKGGEPSRLRDLEPQPDVLPTWLAGSVYMVGDTRWPWKVSPEPSVARMSAADQASVAAVGAYFRREEPDAFHRVKALHDFVVTRLHYDEEAIKPGAVRPPQDAESVLAARKGVCEGYARLLVALGRQTGDRIMFLHGDVRDEDGSASPSAHAWNAAEIHGKWYLIDATWDDPIGAEQSYHTDYLFIPPSVAVFDHLPSEPRWQLLATPLSRGDFLRQPLATPRFAREGLTLVTPERSTVEVNDEQLELELFNPNGHKLLVTVGAGKPDDPQCGSTRSVKAHWSCELPRGLSRVRVWHESPDEDRYRYVAELRATRN